MITGRKFLYPLNIFFNPEDFVINYEEAEKGFRRLN